MTKDERKEYNKRYYLQYKDRIRAQQDTYQKSSDIYKGAQKGYQRIYQASRKTTDPTFKLICNIRSRHNAVLKGKAHTSDGLGCSSDELRSRMEAMWTEGMSWDNYGYGKGKWVIDHILPLDSHHKTTTGDWDPASDYNRDLIHYTNLQPLWFEDNAAKSNKLV